MKRKTSVIIIAAIFTLNIAASMAVHSPLGSIQSTIDSVLEVMRDKSLSLPEKKESFPDTIYHQLQRLAGN